MEQPQLTGHPISSEEEDLDLQRLGLAIKHHWRPAVLVFASVLAIATFTAFTKEPVYQARGKLLLEDQGGSRRAAAAQAITGRLGGLGGLLDIGGNGSIDTQIEVITSKPMLQKAIAQGKLKTAQGQPLTVGAVRSGLTVENIKGTDVLRVNYEGQDPKIAAQIVNQLMRTYLTSQALKDRANITSARQFLQAQAPQAKARLDQAETALRDFKESNQLISPPQEANQAVGILSNLEQQINQTRTELGGTETRSAELRSKLGMGPTEAILTSSLSQSSGVQKVLSDLQQVEADLAKEQTVYQPNHPVVLDLKDKQAALRSLLTDRVGTVMGSQVAGPPQDLQIGGIKQNLSSDLVESEVKRLELNNRLRNLELIQDNYQRQAAVMPQIEQIFTDLERNQQIAQETYTTLVSKLQEAQIQEAKAAAEKQATSRFQILEQATRGGLVPSSKLVTILIGGMLGGILGIALAFFLELIDSSIKTAKEAKEKLGYAVLGTIPNIEGAAKPAQRAYLEPLPSLIPARDTPRSFVSEAYRKLQVNLQFLETNRPVKVMVVTSSVPKEGKSTVSANLAMTMAQRGHRVLLIDADVRCPTQHQIWQLPNTSGLSNFITGETPLAMAVQAVAEGLDILTSGPVPANPSNLLDSDRLSTRLEELSYSYDCVVVDTAPLAVAADSLVLGKLADGLLMVVQPGVVKATNATAARESLEQSHQKVLGLVINGVEPEKEYSQYYSDYNPNHQDSSLKGMPEKLASGFKQLTGRS